MTSRVVSSAFIKTVQKGTQTLNLKYATKTESWERPSTQPTSTVTQGFSSAMDKFSANKVPATAVDAIMV
jgi:hypothetical protein